ncbi:MAG: prephenate dehydrogenase [Burkholderiaceae bacterium]
MQQLVILGAGLIGGSVAAAARAKGLPERIIVIDPDPAQAALRLGLADAQFESLAAWQASLEDGATPSGSTGVVLAAPVPVIAQSLSTLADHFQEISPAWVTELGSTKHAFQAALNGLRGHPAEPALRACFVPTHPMAGSEASGVQAANASLFQGARILVCDLPENTPAAVAAVESFWLSLGGQPTRLPLQDHDAVLAAISHFPHLLAYGLAGLLAHTPVAGLAQTLHGGGLRDTTRIAASSPSLWADILLDNRAELLPLLSAWEQSFGQLSKAVAEDDRARLVALLEDAARWRRGF